MHPAVSFALSVFFGIIFCVQMAATKPSQKAEPQAEDKLKKIYWHANPGTTDDPRETDNPFVQIILPLEISDGSVKYRTYTVDSHGQFRAGEHWRAENNFPNCVEHEFVKPGSPPAK